MRNFEKYAAQGEVNIEIINSMPDGLTPMKPEGESYIIGHSESGHHHVLERADVDVFVGETTPAGMQVLYALVKNPTALSNSRAVTPHDRIGFNAGDVVRFTPSVDFNPYSEEISRAAD